MTIKRSITSIAVAGALAAGSLAPLTTSALADGWRDGRHGGNYISTNDRRRHFNRERHRRFNHHGPRHRYVYRKRKDDRGKAIAIGLGAFFLGLLAAQSAHHH